MSTIAKSAARLRTGNTWSLSAALKNGGPIAWISCLVMGLGNILAGQFIKGLIFLAIEIGFVAFMLVKEGGIHWLSMLPSLGERPMEEIWNDSKGVYEYVMGDNSQLILLYGVATVCIVLVFILVWQASVRSGYKAMSFKASGSHVPTFVDDVKDLFDKNVHKTLMSLPTACLFIFTIIPLVYMMSMAFTNYSKLNDHLVLFDWVGLENFVSIFNPNSTIGKQFWEVLSWTLVWPSS